MFISNYTFCYWSWTGQEYLSKIIIEIDLTEKDFFHVIKSLNRSTTLIFRRLLVNYMELHNEISHGLSRPQAIAN